MSNVFMGIRHPMSSPDAYRSALAGIEANTRPDLPVDQPTTFELVVVVSSTVKDLVAGAGIEFMERGAHALKGVPGEWRLYSVATA